MHPANPLPLAERAVPTSSVAHDRAPGAPRWPWFGVVGSLTSLASFAVAVPTLSQEEWMSGVDALPLLDRAGYHAAFLLGLVSVTCLLVASTGWKRWADRCAGDDLAARTIPTGLAATATVNVIGAALAGSMAIYLPGGSDHGWLSEEAQLVNATYLDFGLLLGWWSAAVAAGCVPVLALRSRPVLPRWMGVVSVVALAPTLAIAAAVGLPGIAGLVMPLWLTIISVGMVLSRVAR